MVAEPAQFKFKGTTVRILSMTQGLPPVSLHHYTTADGLMGMLSGDRAIRFSDAFFLNDGSEMVHGLNLFVETVDNFMREKSDEERRAAELLKQRVFTDVSVRQMLVFCLSSEGNLLNQWRDYGKEVACYSIEFDFQGLIEEDAFNFGAGICKVRYDLIDQRRFLHLLVEGLYADATDGDQKRFEDPEFRERWLSAASAEITWMIVQFKNPAFAAEQEWRLVQPVPPEQGPKFRSSPLGVVPFFEWKYRDPDRRWPVRSITVGPAPHSRTTDLALKYFLSQSGYAAVPTHFSVIPIRR